MRFAAAALSLVWVRLRAQPGQSLADPATFGAVATPAPLRGLHDEGLVFRPAPSRLASGSR
jgi:hypothetical protein